MVSKTNLLAFIDSYDDPSYGRLIQSGQSLDITPVPQGAVVTAPVITSLENGTFAIAISTPFRPVEIHLVNADLTPAAPMVTLADPTSGFVAADDILALPDGGFAVTATFGLNAARRAHVQAFDADGTPRGTPVSLFNDHPAESYNAQLELLGEGYAATASTVYAEGGHLFRVYESDWDPLYRTVADGTPGEGIGDLVPFRNGVMRLVEITANPMQFRQEYYNAAGDLVRASDIGDGIGTSYPVAPVASYSPDGVDVEFFPLPPSYGERGPQYFLAYVGREPDNSGTSVYANLPVYEADPQPPVPVGISATGVIRAFGTQGTYNGVATGGSSIRNAYQEVSEGHYESQLNMVELPDGNALMLWRDYGANATIPTAGDADIFAQIVETEPAAFFGELYGQYVNKETVMRLDSQPGAVNAYYPAAAVNDAGEGLLLSVQGVRYVIESFSYLSQIQVLSDINDNLFLGSDRDDRMRSRRGDDTIRSQDGDDLVIAGAGSEFINGGAGNDTIVANGGNDTVVGATGRDAVLLGLGDDRFIDAPQGGVLGRDSIWGGRGDDTISARGGNDRVYGEAGRDSLRGGAGADYLEGDDGSAVLRPFQNRDTLVGGPGDDTLSGGKGNDELHGGAGADRFEFVATGGRDTVVDFDPAQDILAFDSRIFFRPGTPTPEQIVADYATVRGGNVVFAFETAETTVLQGISSTIGLATAIDIFSV